MHGKRKCESQQKQSMYDQQSLAQDWCCTAQIEAVRERSHAAHQNIFGEPGCMSEEYVTPSDDTGPVVGQTRPCFNVCIVDIVVMPADHLENVSLTFHMKGLQMSDICSE